MNQSSPFRDNVDAAEVAKFNALAARWWDPEGDFRPLHEINPLRLDWIRQNTQLAGRRVVAASLPNQWPRPARRSPASTWRKDR